MAASFFFVFIDPDDKKEKQNKTTTTWPILNYLDHTLGALLHGGWVSR